MTAKKLHCNKCIIKSGNKVKNLWDIANMGTNKKSSNDVPPLIIEGKTFHDCRNTANIFKNATDKMSVNDLVTNNTDPQSKTSIDGISLLWLFCGC